MIEDRGAEHAADPRVSPVSARHSRGTRREACCEVIGDRSGLGAKPTSLEGPRPRRAPAAWPEVHCEVTGDRSGSATHEFRRPSSA
jgi:hypothetical protein